MDVRLREALFSDGRFLTIVNKIGQVKAVGNYVIMTALAQNYWKRGRRLIPKNIWNSANFPKEFIEFELVDEREDGFYLRGSAEFLDDRFISDINKIPIMNRAKSGEEKSVKLTFLDEETSEFISDVSDTIRRRWLNDYEEEQIKSKLEDALEWCKLKGKSPKNVAGLMNKFLSNVPKRKKLNADVVSELDDLLGESDVN